MRICRKLFVVLLGNNHQGKSTAISALVSQGLGTPRRNRKGQHRLVSPTGREIDAYIFGRSYQEAEKSGYHTVGAALDANDPAWRERELIIFPSHRVSSRSSPDDVDEMIEAAHEGGFDAICATLIMTGNDGDDLRGYAHIWQKHWDEVEPAQSAN